jgi:sporulation related protein
MAYSLGQIDPEERTDLYADPREEEYAAAPRRLLRIGGALVVMSVFAGGLWFAYTQGMRHAGGFGDNGDIPLIRADTRPMKVKPENPGGMQIPDRDMLIYGQQRPQVEHLLPPPEQPMARPAPPPPQTPTPQRPVQTAVPSPPSAAPDASASAPPEAGSPAPVVSTAPLSAAAAEAAKMLAPTPAATPQKPSAVRGALPGKSGGVRLQLGAVRSESQARGEWDRIKHQNADLLGKLSAVAIRSDLGDKGVYYRIQAGPVTDASAADRICGALRQRHLACIIVR